MVAILEHTKPATVLSLSTGPRKMAPLLGEIDQVLGLGTPPGDARWQSLKRGRRVTGVRTAAWRVSEL